MQDQQRDAHNDKDLELPLFCFDDIVHATNNFSNKNELGEGGYGPVFGYILLLQSFLAWFIDTDQFLCYLVTADTELVHGDCLASRGN